MNTLIASLCRSSVRSSVRLASPVDGEPEGLLRLRPPLPLRRPALPETFPECKLSTDGEDPNVLFPERSRSLNMPTSALAAYAVSTSLPEDGNGGLPPTRVPEEVRRVGDGVECGVGEAAGEGKLGDAGPPALLGYMTSLLWPDCIQYLLGT